MEDKSDVDFEPMIVSNTIKMRRYNIR